MIQDEQKIRDAIDRKERAASIQKALDIKEGRLGDVPGPGDATPEKTLWEKINQDPTLNSIAQSPWVQTPVAFGDYLSNTASTAAHSILNPLAKAGTGREIPRGNPVQMGAGQSYESAKAASPFMASLGIAALTGNPGLIPATGSAALYGGLTTPEDPIGGMLGAGMFGPIGQFGGEVMGMAGNAIGQKIAPHAREFANKFTNIDTIKAIEKQLTESYTSNKKEALDHLRPVLNEYGWIGLPAKAKESIMAAYERNSDLLGSNIGKLYRRFLDDPTVKNAYLLQSQAGKAMRGGKNKGQITRLEQEALGDFKETALESMESTFAPKEWGFTSFDPSENVSLFRNKYRENVAPYENNRGVNKIIHGETYGLTPEAFLKRLKDASQGTRTKTGKGHEITRAADELEKDLSHGKIYSALATLASGGIPGVAGLLSGHPYAGAGAGTAAMLASHFIGPKISKALLDKNLGELIAEHVTPKVAKAYNKSKAAIVLTGSEEAKKKEK